VSNQSDGAAEGRRILIVDDDIWSVMDMEWVIERLEHQVVGLATTAADAVELADQKRPDLILMDISLAYNSDGIVAAMEIREKFNIASIFITGHSDPNIRKRAMAAHPLGFIQKPFSPSALAAAIATALKH
jgi:two-component system, response regulator PdtaR